MAKNAKPRDSRAGFEIFRRAGSDISLDDLNQRLKDAGYGPVAQRTLDHYRHLVEAGYNRYISINRFDVARAATRHGDLAASPRYPVYALGEGVRILVAKGSRLWTASAKVDGIGEAAVVLNFPESQFASGLADIRVRKGDEVSLHFLESGIEQTGWISDFDLGSEPPIVEVQFHELISLASLSVGEHAPTMSIGLRLRTIDDEIPPTADQLGRRLFLAFDLIDELRGIANATLARKEGGLYSPPAVVDRLSVESPPEFWLEVSDVVKSMVLPGAFSFALREISKIPAMRKTWLEGDLLKEQRDQRAAAREAKQARKDRDAVIARLADQITEHLARAQHLTPQERDRTQRVVYERVGKVLKGLAEAGITEIEDLESLGADGNEAPTANPSDEASDE